MAGPIEVIDAWARASGKALETTAYVTVLNHGTEPDWLIRVDSSRAEYADLRRTVWKGLVAKVQIEQRVPIPPMARTVLAPGKVEIYLRALTQPVHEQDALPLTLTFEHAGQVDVAASVTRHYLGAPE